MSIFLTLVQQMLMMVTLISVGTLLVKVKLLNAHDKKVLGNIMINVSLPCVIITGFFNIDTLSSQEIILSALLGIVSAILSIVVANLIFKNDGILNFATAYGNPGFFGIPLLSAVLGEKVVIYLAFFVAINNIASCTYGVRKLSSKHINVSLVKVIKTPFTLALILGFFIGCMNIELPSFISNSLYSLSNINTPLAMINIGISLAEIKDFSFLKQLKFLKMSFASLIVIPMIILLILMILPSEFNLLKISILIASACPVGLNIPIFAEKYNADVLYATKTIIVSTLLSVFSLPIILALSLVIWHI